MMTRNEIDDAIREIVAHSGIQLSSDFGSEEYTEFLDYLENRGVQNSKELLVILLQGLTQ